MSMDFHRTPETMVRCLISYIECDRRVHSEVWSHFGTSPAVRRIADIRRAERAKAEAFKRGSADRLEMGWDHSGENHARAMALASKRFVEALAWERGA